MYLYHLLTTCLVIPSVKDSRVVMFWLELIIWVTKRNPMDEASM